MRLRVLLCGSVACLVASLVPGGSLGLICSSSRRALGVARLANSRPIEGPANTTKLPSGSSYIRFEPQLLPQRTKRERRRPAPLREETPAVAATLVRCATMVNDTRWTLVAELNQNISTGGLAGQSLVQPIALCLAQVGAGRDDALTGWTADSGHSSTFNCRACSALVMPTSLLQTVPPELALLVRLSFIDHADAIDVIEARKSSELVLSVFARHLVPPRDATH